MKSVKSFRTILLGTCSCGKSLYSSHLLMVFSSYKNDQMNFQSLLKWFLAYPLPQPVFATRSTSSLETLVRINGSQTQCSSILNAL